MNVIQLSNLAMTLPKHSQPLFHHVNMEVGVGEAVALTGLSGAGKSIIAKSIAGIIPTFTNLPLEGEIHLFGKAALTPLERLEGVGYIFQNPVHQLFSNVVELELAFGPENMGLPVEEIQRRVTQVLEDLNLSHYRHHNPSQLSGGQQQLVAIGSVLTLQPSILICDEILSQLDEESCALVVSILKKLKGQGKTIFMVEHDLTKVDFLDKIYLLEDNQVSPLPLT